LAQTTLKVKIKVLSLGDDFETGKQDGGRGDARRQGAQRDPRAISLIALPGRGPLCLRAARPPLRPLAVVEGRACAGATAWSDARAQMPHVRLLARHLPRRRNHASLRPLVPHTTTAHVPWHCLRYTVRVTYVDAYSSIISLSAPRRSRYAHKMEFTLCNRDKQPNVSIHTQCLHTQAFLELLRPLPTSGTLSQKSVHRVYIESKYQATDFPESHRLLQYHRLSALHIIAYLHCVSSPICASYHRLSALHIIAYLHCISSPICTAYDFSICTDFPESHGLFAISSPYSTVMMMTQFCEFQAFKGLATKPSSSAVRQKILKSPLSSDFI